jgi:hypothetical protein
MSLELSGTLSLDASSNIIGKVEISDGTNTLGTSSNPLYVSGFTGPTGYMGPGGPDGATGYTGYTGPSGAPTAATFFGGYAKYRTDIVGFSPTADAVKIIGSVIIPFPLSVSYIEILIETADSNSADYYDIGLFDLSGNLVAHTGAVNMPNTGSQSFALVGGPVSIASGEYLVCMTGNASTVVLYEHGWGGSGGTAGGECNYFLVSTSSSGGALPSSISLSYDRVPSSPYPWDPSWWMPSFILHSVS